jgi:hypothetical protein
MRWLMTFRQQVEAKFTSARKSPTPDSSMKKPSTPKKQSPSTIWKISPLLWQALIGIFVLLFVFTLFKMTTDEVRDYTKSTDSELKSLFFGERPQVIYCHRGGRDEKLPEVLVQYKGQVKEKVGVAMVNCSHILPSGKNVWDRFSLKREWKPSIFAVAPWTKPRQLSPTHLKDITSIKKFLDTALQPKGTDVTTDKDLAKFCGFYHAKSTMDTCIVLLKGNRYSKVHAEIEERYVRSNPHVKVASIDATKLRLSFEDIKENPADAFAIKLHAIRNGTHYSSMNYPSTFDYLQTFTVEALGYPIESYYPVSTIKLVKVAASAFKDRSAPRVPPRGSSSSNDNDDEGMDKASRKSRRDSERAKRGGGGGSKESGSSDVDSGREQDDENEIGDTHEGSRSSSGSHAHFDDEDVIEL